MRIRALAATTALTSALTLFATTAAQADPDPGADSASLSGQINIPLHPPINLCSNTIDIVALLNPSAGNTCIPSG
jgi:hypothetical protein